MLWFDVGVKRYTTDKEVFPEGAGCGLMQESKDIQHAKVRRIGESVVV